MNFHHFNNQVYDADSIVNLAKTMGTHIRLEADMIATEGNPYVHENIKYPVVVLFDNQYLVLAMPVNFTGDQIVDVTLLSKPALKKIKVG